jgi:hypothetical protein
VRGVAKLAAEIGDDPAQRLASLISIVGCRPIEAIDTICLLSCCFLFDCFLWVLLRYYP